VDEKEGVRLSAKKGDGCPVERQEHNRFRFWAKVEEFEGRILRVITLDD